MNILSIDSSRFLGSVSYIENKKLKFSTSFSVKATYSEKLLYLIDFVLESVEKKLTDLDLVVVSEGPGSFTGLRIGVAVAKTICYVNEIPLVGIDSLRVLADKFPVNSKIIVPILNARRNQVFASAYKYKNDKFHKLIKTGSYKLNSFLNELQSFKGEKIFIGEAFSKYKNEISKIFKSFEFIKEEYSNFDPYLLGLLGLKKYNKKGPESIIDFEPAYYRKSDAEINYEKNKNS